MRHGPRIAALVGAAFITADSPARIASRQRTSHMERFYCRHLCAAVVALLLTVGTLVSSGPTKLPPEFKLCKRDENLIPCLQEAFTGGILILAAGIPEFNIPPLEPIHVPQVEMGDGDPNAPVNLRINFTDVVFQNINTAKPSNIKADLDNYMISFHGHMDKIYGEANYMMDGRILLLPAKGSGRVTFNISNVEVDIQLKGVKNIKKNKEYMKVVDLTCVFEKIDNAELHFYNLFNGDEALGNNINALINENWNDFYLQLKGPLEQSFQHTFKEFARRIFDKVPMDDIFLRE